VVAASSRDRALRIVQGIAAALNARGHHVGRNRPAPVDPAGEQTVDPVRYGRPAGGRGTPLPPEPATFEVSIGSQTLLVDLYEEKQTVSIVPPEAVAKLKYDWQRATPVETEQFNGRLALRIRGYSPSQGWADRKRWTLESRLPRFVRTLEDIAASRSDARDRADEAKRQRRLAWEQAVPKARASYLADLNRGRLEEQLEQFARAQQLRAYADAIALRAAGMDGEVRASAEVWAAWVRGEAERHDPTMKEANLAFVEREDIRPWDLDKYLPHGFTAAHPPD